MLRKCLNAVPVFAAILALASTAPARAQGVTLPPSGDNEKSVITQYLGPESITVSYSSPDVHAPDGSDRRGKIWGPGALIPYGYHQEGFGTCGQKCPWRGGANENTTVALSHQMMVEGKPLPAGTYGLHILPGEKEWTIIFSKNSTSWGSFFYDENDDALRVTVKPNQSAYHEWLEYDFIDRHPAKAVLALQWEDLSVPITFEMPDQTEVYYKILSEELRNSPGFDWHGWQQAANYLADQKVHLDEAETWAKNAVSMPFIGAENFDTLSTLAKVEKARGRDAQAKETMDKALAHPTTTSFDVYQYARPMIRDGKPQEALAIFQAAAKRMPKTWPLDLGIARAQSAMGDYGAALKSARTALALAPDQPNKDNVTRMIAKLEKGEDMNK